MYNGFPMKDLVMFFSASPLKCKKYPKFDCYGIQFALSLFDFGCSRYLEDSALAETFLCSKFGG